MTEQEIYDEIEWLIYTNYSVLNDTFYINVYYQHLNIQVPEQYYICYSEYISTEEIRLAPWIKPEQLN